MPSPFPGMDPYIESSGEWGDFHTSLLAAIRGRLNAVLPRRFRARIELFVFIHEPEARSRRRRLEPDVYLIERPERPKPAGGAPRRAAPAAITLPAARRRKSRSVIVVDKEMRRVVTAIEVLSPSNKEVDDDRTAYLTKRDQYLANRVSLVEIDLLRGGRRLPLGQPRLEIKDYYVMVCRAWEFPRADIWSFGLRDRLPEVPIPLVPDVPDTLLPLRPCVDRAYDEGTYDTELDYDRPLRPRLSRGDMAWVRRVLAGRPSTNHS